MDIFFIWNLFNFLVKCCSHFTIAIENIRILIKTHTVDFNMVTYNDHKNLVRIDKIVLHIYIFCDILEKVVVVIRIILLKREIHFEIIDVHVVLWNIYLIRDKIVLTEVNINNHLIVKITKIDELKTNWEVVVKTKKDIRKTKQFDHLNWVTVHDTDIVIHEVHISDEVNLVLVWIIKPFDRLCVTFWYNSHLRVMNIIKPINVVGIQVIK